MTKILKAGDKFKIEFQALPDGYIRLIGDFPGEMSNVTLPPGEIPTVFWEDGGLRLATEDARAVHHAMPMAVALVDYFDAQFPHWKESTGPEDPSTPGSTVVIKVKHCFRVLRSMLGIPEPTP